MPGSPGEVRLLSAAEAGSPPGGLGSSHPTTEPLPCAGPVWARQLLELGRTSEGWQVWRTGQRAWS